MHGTIIRDEGGAMNPQTPSDLMPLIERMLDGTATLEQKRQLIDALTKSPKARQYYARCVFMRALFVRSPLLQSARLSVPSSGSGATRLDLTETMVRPAIDVGPTPTPSLAPDPYVYYDLKHPVAAAWNWRHIGGFGIAAALLISLLILGALLGRASKPTPVAITPTVAVFVAEVNARWGTGGEPLHPGDKISAGPLDLASGEVKIQIASGASVILQGPAHLLLRAENGVDLMTGKLTATVPPEARGFTLHTASGQVVDLGTEFGAEVKSDNTVEVDVFRGTVQAQPGESGQPPVNLLAGQAANVSATGLTIDPNGANPQRFVRSLTPPTNSLDIVDLLCGGDGTTHLRGRGINVLSGNAGDVPQVGWEAADWKYHRVPQLPVVDGCFIPDGSHGPMEVDSVGHMFAFSPAAKSNYNVIWAGGTIPRTLDKTGHYVVMSSILGNVDYSLPPHGLVAMHTNKGITFDLDAIRHLHPASGLARFRSIVGNSWTETQSFADLFILIDGKLVYKTKPFSGADGPMTVDLPLQAQDHFLTIVVYHDRGSVNNFVLLGDPVFSIAGQ
jgi:hypothetical protein